MKSKKPQKKDVTNKEDDSIHVMPVDNPKLASTAKAMTSARLHESNNMILESFDDHDDVKIDIPYPDEKMGKKKRVDIMSRVNIHAMGEFY